MFRSVANALFRRSSCLSILHFERTRNTLPNRLRPLWDTPRPLPKLDAVAKGATWSQAHPRGGGYMG